MDEVYLIYTKIQNALTAEPVMLQLLPLERSHFAPLPPALGDPHGEVEMFPMRGRCSSRSRPSTCTA